MTGNAPTQGSAAPFGGAAFIRDTEAAHYLGVCTRTITNMVAAGKLKKVYPRPPASRLTVESVIAYREAIEAGRPPKIWSQPGNPHTMVEETHTPAPKRTGLLSRWGLGGGGD